MYVCFGKWKHFVDFKGLTVYGYIIIIILVINTFSFQKISSIFSQILWKDILWRIEKYVVKYSNLFTKKHNLHKNIT